MSDAPITYEQLFDTLRREKSRDDLQKLDKAFYDGVRVFLSTKEDLIRSEQSPLAVTRATIEYQNVKKILRELYERRERKIITMALHRTRTDAAIIDNDALLPEEKLFLESLVHLMLQNREQILSTLESRAPIIVTPGRPAMHAEQRPAPSQSYSPTYSDMDMRPRAGEAAAEPARFEVSSRAVEDEAPDDAPGDTYTTVESQINVRFLAPVPKFVGKDLRVFGPYEEGQTAKLPDDIAQILIKKGRAQEMDP